MTFCMTKVIALRIAVFINELYHIPPMFREESVPLSDRDFCLGSSGVHNIDARLKRMTEFGAVNHRIQNNGAIRTNDGDILTFEIADYHASLTCLYFATAILSHVIN